jgi:hypothetical protein
MGVLAITLVLPLCAAAASSRRRRRSTGWNWAQHQLAVVYLRPEADFSAIAKVALLDCAVAFKKDWQRNQNSTNRWRSRQRTWTIFVRHWHDVLRGVRDVLTKGGYELTDKGVTTSWCSAAIIDLNISSPAAAEAGRSKTYATSAGDDDVSRSLRFEHQRDLARTVDRKQATTTGA